MRLNIEGVHNKAFWENAGVVLPKFNIGAVREATKAEPVWLHFGAGNIFRGFIASLQQQLLNEGHSDKGIIAAEAFDGEIIDRIYKPHDSLVMNVLLGADGTMDCGITASITESVRADEQTDRLAAIFECPSLQMVSFTITEKGYAPRGIMSVVAGLMLKRYKAGKLPLALVSMDNCSKNGEKLRSSIVEAAESFKDNGFLEYLRDENTVSFPWSMVDKITPRPDDVVFKYLTDKGIEGMGPVLTAKNTYIAPFVNAEKPQYLVIEDNFPNGRPALEHAGVYLTGRETVNKTERMKVTTCLNPLHTAMAVFGCLLGYTKISDEMKDAEITALIKKMGYIEGLPVVTDPGIISPRAFIDEVVHERLPNPFMPDAPQRIATDTSQKAGIRFGETIKSYIEEKRDLNELTAIPLAIAGWIRYLLGVDDIGRPMEISPDPMKNELQEKLAGVVWDEPGSYDGHIIPILSNSDIFGLDLTGTELAGRIEKYFVLMLAGPGSVRKTLTDRL
ncbi:MAG: mannitol dehydrogenase family protein [Defluviitaleaceae bacterium]|nr:mannitol dehydrogenase family protein [Defluviitaleaceae bacterium]MCL2836350.1 mannitol dehydrogenase family protein [Defluviitaleaceae bacterium]